MMYEVIKNTSAYIKVFMKIQLLMIIAVIASSLLTISQRVSAQETSQLRWLEPTVEQRFNEVSVPDKDHGSDNSYVTYTYFGINVLIPDTSDFFYYHFPTTSKTNRHTHPRAPPFSLI